MYRGKMELTVKHKLNKTISIVVLKWASNQSVFLYNIPKLFYSK